MNSETGDEYNYPNTNEKFESPRGLIIGIGNVGSIGAESDLSEGNVTVRRNIISFMARIRNKYDRIDALLLQETNNYTAAFPPHMNCSPTQTDEHVTYGQGDGGKRGVASWVPRADSFKEEDERRLLRIPKDQRNEIAVSIVRYKNAKYKSIPVGLINVYRNAHATYNRSVDETKQAVERICIKLRYLGIRNHVVVGDFNSESIKFNNLTEIKHQDLYHKANLRTKKTRIDHVFTNMINMGFLEVWPSLENVHGQKLTCTNSVLGHKAFCLWIGHKPQKIDKITIKTTPIDKLKAQAREWDSTISTVRVPVLRLLRDYEKDEHCDENNIDEAAMSLISMIRIIKDRASKKTKIPKNEPHTPLSLCPGYILSRSTQHTPQHWTNSTQR